jgi:methionine aminopeptidase
MSIGELDADAVDSYREAGAGLAFPVNISVDEAASHATPARDDDTEFGDEMVCLDIGVHVDGYIADAAVTVEGVPRLRCPGLPATAGDVQLLKRRLLGQ